MTNATVEPVRDVIAEAVLSDTPDGFRLFYNLVNDRDMPPHAQDWIKDIYAAEGAGLDALIEAFRGSTKTTTITQTFTAYRIGLKPLGSTLLIQAGDDSANENTARISDIIKNNLAWRKCFPYVKPDERQGWGAKGYEVIDTRDEGKPGWYETFRRHRGKDPTLLGVGYKSNEIVGKHPDNLLIIDDIVTEEVASSEIELRKVVTTFSGTIMPTRRPNHPLTLLVGTPWNSKDVLALAKIKWAEDFRMIRTPVYEVGQPGGGTEYNPRTGEFVKLAWPEAFDVAAIEKEKRLDLTGGPEFDRMYLLVLGSGLKRQLAYQTYPAFAIDPHWPTAGGCDPIGAGNSTGNGQTPVAQHHFALAYIAKVPTGGAVITGGVLEQCSHPEGLQYIRQAQSIFRDWLGCVVEGGGENEGFVQMILMVPDLLVLPMKTGNKHKADRIVKGVGSWTRIGRVRISDASSPFLDSLRAFANAYPNVSQSDSGWDAWDAVYWALKLLPDVLAMPESSDDLGPRIRGKKENPFNSLGSQSYN